MCYLAGMGLKLWDRFNNDNIPFALGCLGGAIGIIAFLFVPNTVITENILEALMIGIASGLSSTGVDQLVKRTIMKKDNQ